MGKRSNFSRVARDFYPTPAEAVAPLLQHLPAGASYVEPCAGRGDLVNHLSRNKCIFASDITPGVAWVQARDAFEVVFHSSDEPDLIITNPPWSRDILHPLIRHFATQRPTWLLIDADWFHTRQAAEFMPWLVKYVSVGRVKWIPDSSNTGKDNCAWYLFDALHTGPCLAFGRDGIRQC